MNTHQNYSNHLLAWAALLSLISAAHLGAATRATSAEPAAPADPAVKAEEPADTNAAPADESRSPRRERRRVVVRSVEPTDREERSTNRNQPWLGVSTEESSEALTSQLGLTPGVGLVVVYLAPDSPAAKAGLQKNDLLVELDGQTLVVPAQLRKLIRVHKPGDSVKVVFYRAGKKDTADIELTKSPAQFGLQLDDSALGDLQDLQKQLGDLHLGEALRAQMNALRQSLGNMKIDQGKVREEVQRSLEEARRAVEQALRQSSGAIGEAGKALRELEKSRIEIRNDAKVTVRSSDNAVKSVVQSDDSGTIVIVSNPKPHLTAHDKEGKLIFDGEIATPEQRDKVPRDLWDKVEPLLDKMGTKDKAEQE